MRIYTKDRIKHPLAFVIVPHEGVMSPLPLIKGWRIVELDGRSAIATHSYSEFMRMKAFIGADKMMAFTGIELEI